MYLIQVEPGQDDNSWTVVAFRTDEQVVVGEGDQRHIAGDEQEATWVAGAQGTLHGSLMNIVEAMQVDSTPTTDDETQETEEGE